MLCAFASPAQSQCQDAFLETRQWVLDQDTQLLGNIESAALHPAQGMAVATADPNVVLLDAEGQFRQDIGRVGQGPFEYQGPLVLRFDGDRLAVWDRGNRKLITFDQDGQALQEWTGISRNFSNFALQGDTLFAYHGGGLREDYIAAYARQDRGNASIQLGQAPEAHFPLSLLDGSSPIAYDATQQQLLYASPAEPIMHVHNTDTGATSTVDINDNAFNTDAVQDYQTLEDINSDILGASEQAFKSSRFSSIHAVGGGLILAVLQHGVLEYERSFSEAVDNQADGGGTFDVGGLATNTRRLHVHLLNADGEQDACQSLSLSEEAFETDDPILGHTDRGFLTLRTQTNEAGDIDYVLTEYYVPDTY
ncbi:MAG: 6-bladed beta-propeller [Bacteroidota bacterium]